MSEGGARTRTRTRTARPLGAAVAVALAVALALTLALAAGCAPGSGRGPTSGDTPASAYTPEQRALLALQTPASVWWTGNGDYAVLQAVGEDGRLTVETWERETGKRRSLPHYRVVGVEPHAARIWVVPDDRPVPLDPDRDSAEPRIIDIAGDGIDTLPSELYAVDLAQGEEPRSDVDARWRAWDGTAGYSASVEIDINKGACPSTLRFYETGGSRNAWSAKVPTDVVTFEPVGWSPSGQYFAVITQADESATAAAVDRWAAEHGTAAAKGGSGSAPEPPPTLSTSIVAFRVADGSVVQRIPLTAPVLVPTSGSSLATWCSQPIDAMFAWVDWESGSPMINLMAHFAMPRPGGTDFMPFFPEGTSAPEDMLDGLSPSGGQMWMAGTSAGYPVTASLPSGSGPNGSSEVRMIGGSIGSARGTVTARYVDGAGLLSLRAYTTEDPRWIVYLGEGPGEQQDEALAVDGPKGPVRGGSDAHGE